MGWFGSGGLRRAKRQRTDRVRMVTHPAFYLAQAGVAGFEAPETLDVDGTVEHFAAVGQAAGARVSALFQPDCYLSRAQEAGLEVTGDPFEHWLEVGWDHRVVPTPLFDEQWYAAADTGARAGEWGFEHFLREGCYRKGRDAGPFAPNYGDNEAMRARERHDPVLMTGMLNHAERYDLRRTSWLEEGVAKGRERLDSLDDPRVVALVAKAAAIEPEIMDEGPGRWVAWLPHLHPNVVTATAAEDVRRSLPVDRADAVVYFPDDGPHDDALRVVEELRSAGATTVVAVTTGPRSRPPEGIVTADLRPRLTRLDRRQRLRVALDVLRGLAPAHAVAVDNVLGTRVLARHGRALRTEMTVAGRLEGRALDLDAMVEVQRVRDEQ
ncbi:MAG: hypothetical protein FWE71_09345 [Nocardioidaceae bacterium]|nr:hypothetical protein [Nocardioidaceae bacterium]MCL2612320.1 hypothetical protein [Nocardioidaceae bacterium]